MFAKKRKTPCPVDEEAQKAKAELLRFRMNDFSLPDDNNEQYRIAVEDAVKEYPFIQELLDLNLVPEVYRLPDDSVAVYIKRYIDAMEEKEIIQELERLDLAHFLWGRPTRRLFTYIDKNPPPPLSSEEKKRIASAPPQLYKRGPNKGKAKPPLKIKRDKQAFPPGLKAVAERLEPIAGLPLNKALINKYRRAKCKTKKGEWTQGAGKDNMPPHRDSECIFGKNKPIVSVSLGEGRLFYIQHESSGKALRFRLGHGDLLLMTPILNKHCVHWVPNEPLLAPVQDRWNITFRSVIPKK